MRAKASIICVAALIGVVALAQPPSDSIEITLENDLPPPPPQPLSPGMMAAFKQWKSKDFEAKVKAATLRGEAAARHDIKVRRFRLRECGKPAGTREIDPGTGYTLEWLGSCEHLDSLSTWEAKAYNETMLDWYRRHPKKGK